jgi:hypothetical protein
MCEFIKAPNVAMGWGCCRCRVYNGIQRVECKQCGFAHHEPLELKGDCAVGVYYEDGGATSVKVLEVRADADGVGLKLEATATRESSRLVNDIPTGEVFNVWRKHDAGAYGGMWRLE